jgi:YidC/Oxa1 family membrane protein insertase
VAKKFFTWLLIFIGISLILQSFQSDDTETTMLEDFVLQGTQDSYNIGDAPVIEIYNNLDRLVRVPTDCPQEPLIVERYRNGLWEKLVSSEGKNLVCLESAPDLDVAMSTHQFVQPSHFELKPDSMTSVDYSPWKDELFSSIGKYRVSMEVESEGAQKIFMTEFDIEERGFFSSVSFRLFFQPIFNFLLFLTSILPGYSFGLAVIALTMIIRLILLVPNQKALKSQQSMMKIQPELEEIKRKYKGDQQRISLETMELWKKHRVNPVGGCLPLLIQLPILIALFYVVKIGFSPYQGHIVYDFLSHIDLAKVSTDFYGILNLEAVNATWLPILVGLLQFVQMKLSFSRKKIGVKETPEKHELAKKEENSDPTQALQDPLRMMNKTMLYFMPVMMAFMVATLPSGVGLYLAVSTLFGIAQQFYVNRSQ